MVRINEPGVERLSFRTLGRIFRHASSEWMVDNATRLGASVAFYTLLSLAPLIVIVVAVGAVIYGKEAAQGRLTVRVDGARNSSDADAAAQALQVLQRVAMHLKKPEAQPSLR